jgi:WD40 repeat protein
MEITSASGVTSMNCCYLQVVVLSLALAGIPSIAACSEHGPAGKPPQKGDPLVVAELGGSKWHLGPVFSPDGAWLLVAGTEEDAKDHYVVTKWDVRSRKILAKFPIATRVCLDTPTISPSGRAFAVGDQKGAIVVCDSTEGKVIFTFQQWEGRGNFVKLLTFLDDDHVLSVDNFSVGQKRNIRDNRTWIYRIGDPYGLSGVAVNRRKDCVAYLTLTALNVLGADLKEDIASIKHGLDAKRPILGITDDGAYGLAADAFTQLTLYDLKGKKLVRRWQGHNSGKGEGLVNGVACIVALTDRQIFVTSDYLGYVRFWNVKGEQLASVRRYPRLVSTLAVSPDNKLLATGGDRQPIVLWDLEKILSGKN